MSDKPTLEQLRARDALKAIREVEGAGKTAESYGREANGLAATIVNNGLGQACAMLLSKNDDGAKAIYTDMGEWLASRHYASPYDSDALIDEITGNGQRKYVHAQAEALAWLEWTKKFARAYLVSGGEDG